MRDVHWDFSQSVSGTKKVRVAPRAGIMIGSLSMELIKYFIKKTFLTLRYLFYAKNS